MKDISQLVTALEAPDFKKVEPHLANLDKHLILRSYIEGYSFTNADNKIWVTIRSNKVANAFVRRGALINLLRWFTFIEETHPEIQQEIKAKDDAVKAKIAAGSKAGGGWDTYNEGLQDTEKGVVTRFPPEPSGYLHIGHMKAAIVNEYFAHFHKGTLLLRFDDTNPDKESKEFEESIMEDVALMGIKPDKTSYTSDHFETLYQYCIRLIKEGHAYADNTPQETMAKERGDRIASKNRDKSVEDNLAIFEEMKKGSKIGQSNCIRAKISFNSDNGTLRDPVIYRCNVETPHHRTGTTWKMYPGYDFACPVVDSVEGVTHCLRTTEYNDRHDQYQWFIKTLNLRKVHVSEFGRMNFIRTFLSKRKLTKMVDAGKVWGWDDPRMPTLRGVHRRGMTVAALREFILKQGPSRNIVNMDWHNFWAINKKEIDPVAPRHTGVDEQNVVKAHVINGPADMYTEDKPKHPKNPAIGTKKVTYSKHLILDQVDAKAFKLDEEITLMSWGNAFVRKITANDSGIVTDIELELHLDGDFKKTEKKVTWLSSDGVIQADVYEFGDLITKDALEKEDDWQDYFNESSCVMAKQLCDANVVDLKAGNTIQLERKGYYRVDKSAKDGLVLFGIPTGKLK